MYSGYGTTFDSAGAWSFGNDDARNVVIFRIDNNSSSHAHIHKKNVLVLSEGQTFGINGSFGSVKGLLLILVKQRQNFA